MKLPGLPFLKSKSEAQYILVLLLRQEKVNAVIIEKIGGTVRILNQHEEFFSTNLEDVGDEEWLDIIDAAITRAEETLPPQIETHQTVLGLPNSWIENKQIKKEYLVKLKHASGELDLKPIGFIEIPEAIIHSIGDNEGAPVSAILAEIGKKYIVLTLFRAGRIIETKTSALKASSVATVDTALKDFNAEVLPARLIIYNGSGVEDLSQTFTHHHWSKSIQFLHMPQILLLEKGFDIDAVVAGAASQLGASAYAHEQHVSKSKGIVLVAAPSQTAKDIEQAIDRAPTENLPLDEESASAFGFVIGEDIEKLPKKESLAQGAEIKDVVDPEAESLRAKTDKDDRAEDLSTGPKINDPYASTGDAAQDLHRNLKEPDLSEQSSHPSNTKKGLFEGIAMPSFLANLAGMLPKGGPKNRLFLLLPALLVLLIVLTILYVTMLKATIEVTVRPEVAEEEESVVFATSGSSDFKKNILAAKTTTVEVSGSVSTKATGEEEVGEKAKGTVTIFNSSQGKKELAQGAVITSSNNLDFVLDKEVIIASASGDIFAGIKSGTAKVPVTASKIGKEYNIPSNTTFKIGGDSSLGAKNDEAFSGGSKEEKLVVAKSDLAELAKELPETLKKKAEDQINQNLGGNEILLTVYADFTPSPGDYSAKEGDESTNVSLESTVEFTGVFYENSELVDFTKTLIKEKLSRDLILDEKNIKNTITDIEEKDGDYLAKLFIEADLLPRIDKTAISEKIKGKSFAQANMELEELPQVISSEIELFPPLPFLTMLPRRAENIEIRVSAND